MINEFKGSPWLLRPTCVRRLRPCVRRPRPCIRRLSPCVRHLRRHDGRLQRLRAVFERPKPGRLMYTKTRCVNRRDVGRSSLCFLKKKHGRLSQFFFGCLQSGLFYVHLTSWLFSVRSSHFQNPPRNCCVVHFYHLPSPKPCFIIALFVVECFSTPSQWLPIFSPQSITHHRHSHGLVNSQPPSCRQPLRRDFLRVLGKQQFGRLTVRLRAAFLSNPLTATKGMEVVDNLHC